ncbi:MAG: outer membrane beta-barrel protein [Pyrinomonadaceae bacterium]
MHRKFFYASIALLLLLLLAPASLHAQTRTDEHKTEVGGFITAIGLERLDGSLNGVGGRFAYNFTKNFALDTEASFFPSDKFGNQQTGQRAQAFAGIRAGGRTRYVGVFAKARPGVMFIGDSVSGFRCNSSGSVCRPSHNNLAFDAGAIVEFYPTSRAIIRVDAGDTIVRQRNVAGLGFFGPATSSTDISHNFQASIGFGYRF